MVPLDSIVWPFLYFPVDGYLDCFHFTVLITLVALAFNIIFLWIHAYFCLEGMPRRGILGVIVLDIFTYKRNHQYIYVFLSTVILFYILIKNEGSSVHFMSLPNVGVVHVKNFIHSDSCVDALIYISLRINYNEHLFTYSWAICIYSFVKYLSQSFTCC